MSKLFVIFAIIAVAFAQSATGDSNPVATIFDTCDLSNHSYVLYAGDDNSNIDNLEEFPYEIKAIIFQDKGKLTFYSEEDAQGNYFVVDHDLECIEEGQLNWSDEQAQYFIMRNNKLKAKLAKQLLSKKQGTISA